MKKSPQQFCRFAQGLVVPGTLIGYDDWWVNSCSLGSHPDLHPMDAGEGRAHLEIVLKYAVKMECVAGPCGIDVADRLELAPTDSIGGLSQKFLGVGAGFSQGHKFLGTSLAWRKKTFSEDCSWGPIFRVVGIGVSGAEVSHGFAMDAEQVGRWKDRNPHCQRLSRAAFTHHVSGANVVPGSWVRKWEDRR